MRLDQRSLTITLGSPVFNALDVVYLLKILNLHGNYMSDWLRESQDGASRKQQMKSDERDALQNIASTPTQKSET